MLGGDRGRFRAPGESPTPGAPRRPRTRRNRRASGGWTGAPRRLVWACALEPRRLTTPPTSVKQQQQGLAGVLFANFPLDRFGVRNRRRAAVFRKFQSTSAPRRVDSAMRWFLAKNTDRAVIARSRGVEGAPNLRCRVAPAEGRPS